MAAAKKRLADTKATSSATARRRASSRSSTARPLKNQAAQKQPSQTVVIPPTIHTYKSEPLDATFDRPAKKYLPKPPKIKKPRKPLHLKEHLARWQKHIYGTIALLCAVALLTSPLCDPLWAATIKHSVSLSIIDATYSLPVPNVSASLNGEAIQTETKAGTITFAKVPTGSHTLLISRDGYTPVTLKLRLGPLSGDTTRQVVMQPTGRQIIVKTLDALSEQPVSGALVTAIATTNTSNQSGQASITIKPNELQIPVTITAPGYTNLTTTLDATDNSQFTIRLTPAGRAYYFHKTGEVTNLYSINLDATDPKIMLPGTLPEASPPTMARSPDTRWLAFTSNRDGSRDASGAYIQKLLLLDTTSNSLVPMHDDYARFKIVGWTKANQLIYTLERITTDFQPASKYQIRRYNPADGSDVAIFSNRSNPTNTNKNYKRDQEGYVGIYEQLYTEPIIHNDYLVYAFRREAKPGYGHLLPPRTYIVIADSNGATLRTVRQNTGGYLYPKDLGNGRISYFDYSSGEKYYELELATGKESLLPPNKSEPARRVFSPDGSHVAWEDSVNGTNTIKVARINGQEERTIAVGFALTVQSWFGNNYVLLDSADTAFSLSIASIYGGAPLRLTEYQK